MVDLKYFSIHATDTSFMLSCVHMPRISNVNSTGELLHYELPKDFA
jgi:hypothetical protein